VVPYKLPVSPFQAVVLLYNVAICKEAANDADRTVQEIMEEINENNGYLPKGLLESGLYCCNMNEEDKKFWHPYGHDFDRFVKGVLIPKKFRFDKVYNSIHEVKDGAHTQTPKSETVG
jgi:hypothetical protein